MMKIKMIRSRIGANPKQRKVLAALGLTRLNQVKEVKDNAAMRGMINMIPHLVIEVK